MDAPNRHSLPGCGTKHRQHARHNATLGERFSPRITGALQ